MRSWSLSEGTRRRRDARAQTDVDDHGKDTPPTPPDGADDVPEAASCPELPSLEDDVFALLSELFEEPGELESLEVMHKRLDAYLDEVREAFHHNDYIDIDLVDTLGDIAKSLLTAAEDMPDRQRRLAHAAVEYFVRSEDAHDDMVERTGFGDDMDVLTAVTRHVGCEDLIPKRL